MLKAQVLCVRGSLVGDLLIPAAYAASIPHMIDVFILSSRPLKVGEILELKPLSYCQIMEEGDLSLTLLAALADETPTKGEIKAFEAKLGRYLHRQYDIAGWGNAAAVKKLLALRYNLTI